MTTAVPPQPTDVAAGHRLGWRTLLIIAAAAVLTFAVIVALPMVQSLWLAAAVIGALVTIAVAGVFALARA